MMGLSWPGEGARRCSSYASSVPPCTGGVLLGGNVKRGRLMTRIMLAVLVLLNCTAFATEVFAQSNQVTNPVPLTPPTVNTTTTTCQVNCDTQAMNCQNSCIPSTAAVTANPAASSGSGACNLSCTTQQLVCKQRC